jgi:glycosyltransferase involved in cell wall biosynthesis
MKILLATYFPRSLDLEGGERIVDSLARSYVASAAEVTVLAPLRNKPYKVIDYAQKGKNGISSYLTALRKLAPGFDVVHLFEPTPSTLFFSSFCSKYNHNTYATIISPNFDFRFILKNFNRQSIYHFLTKNGLWTFFWSFPCKKYFVSTDFQKKQLIKCGVDKDKVMTIPYGLMAEDFKPVDKQKAKKMFGFGDKFVIGYLGHFHHNKDLTTLLKAFSLINNKKVFLAIAWSGKGTASKKVLSLIKDHQNSQRIKMFGIVHVNSFLSALDAVVLPYPHGCIPHFPLVALEAIAANTPLIISDVGGMKELGNSCILVEPKNPKSIVLAVRTLMNRSVANRLSKNQKLLFRSRFDSRGIARRLLAIFRKDLKN